MGETRIILMKRKYSSLIKNIGLFTVGSFGSKIISFLMVPLYTAVLSTSDYGQVDLLMTTTQLLMPILLLSIPDATLRFGLDPEYNKEDVISTTVNIIFKGSALLLVCIILLKITNIIYLPAEYCSFLFLSFFGGSISNCFNIYLKAKNKVSAITVSGILCTIFMCSSNVLSLLVLNMGINGYMLSYLIGVLIQVMYQFISGGIYRDLKIKWKNNLTSEMVRYSVPLISNSIAWWINSASDRYILTLIKGITINGIYSVSYKIPTILVTIQSIFYNAWSISAIAEFDENDRDGFIGNNYTLYSLVSVMGCSIILIFNQPMASLLYKGEFFAAWEYVPFLLVGMVFNGISQFEGSLFAASKRTKQVSLTTVIGAVINIILNFIFIYAWGAVGAATATMVGYFTTWLLRTILIHGFVRIKVRWKMHIISVTLLTIEAILATFNVLFEIQIVIVLIEFIIYFILFKHRYRASEMR